MMIHRVPNSPSVSYLTGSRLNAIPNARIAGLLIAALDMDQTAALIADLADPAARRGRPIYMTSANGEVISRCHRDPILHRHFASADVISADGQPMVAASKLLSQTPLPERVATTDLFHVVARLAVERGLTFYLYGASEEENAQAAAKALAQHPGLRIIGRSHGYLAGASLRRKIAEIDALAPDILWIGLGVPREQTFVAEFADSLRNVGVIKTSGGLFNFLSGSRSRAPEFMQRLGLEWVWRTMLEPRRLFWRYAVTNPHAAYLLFTRTG
jgi:N-acetylglucosaminyldiphosphoundecaprenol N-acetyl-beta-D-mannosaminyltransferase